MNHNEKWHTRAKIALKSYFIKRSLTRVTLGFLISLTGLFGFLLSFAMLHFGVSQMWIRYPVAVLGAYGAFLAMIRIWVEIERARFDLQSAEMQSALRDVNLQEEPQVQYSQKNPSWTEWLDLGDIHHLDLFDAEGGCLAVVLIGVAIGLAVLLASCLANLPTLFAEGFLDTFLVVGLYRRLRIAAKEHWLGTTIRKTWTTAFTVAAILALAGWAVQTTSPEAQSIGPVIKELLFPEK